MFITPYRPCSCLLYFSFLCLQNRTFSHDISLPPSSLLLQLLVLFFHTTGQPGRRLEHHHGVPGPERHRGGQPRGGHVPSHHHRPLRPAPGAAPKRHQRELAGVVARLQRHRLPSGANLLLEGEYQWRSSFGFGFCFRTLAMLFF